MNEADARRRLEAEKERLQKLQKELSDEQGDGSEGARTELSSVDQHPADAGSETFEREKDMAILNSFEEQESEIDLALQRVGTDAFGICEVCGEPIAEARLEAIPWTRNCLKHQAEMDKAG